MPISANAQAVSPAAHHQSTTNKTTKNNKKSDGQKEGMAWRLEAFQFGKEHGLARIFQHLAHVARNALLYVQKYLAITGSAQCVAVGLRIALVFAAQLLGKRDVLDQALLPHFSQRERRELFFRFGGAQGI